MYKNIKVIGGNVGSGKTWTFENLLDLSRNNLLKQNIKFVPELIDNPISTFLLKQYYSAISNPQFDIVDCSTKFTALQSYFIDTNFRALQDALDSTEFDTFVFDGCLLFCKPFILSSFQSGFITGECLNFCIELYNEAILGLRYPIIGQTVIDVFLINQNVDVCQKQIEKRGRGNESSSITNGYLNCLDYHMNSVVQQACGPISMWTAIHKSMYSKFRCNPVKIESSEQALEILKSELSFSISDYYDNDEFLKQDNFFGNQESYPGLVAIPTTPFPLTQSK
ncbi:hypothetical protein ACTFIY_004566 [Dictyostelium cf. discoideum]